MRFDAGASPHRPSRDGRTLLRLTVAGSVVLALCVLALVPAADYLGSSVGLEDTLGPLRTLDQRSTVYAADFTPLGRLGIQDRQDAQLSQVPQKLVHAVVDTEDATFFTNPGVDVAAMTRSLVKDVTSGEIREGGSTITQQLVKNRLLSPRRNLHRKLSELSLALQLARRYSKRRILEEYLNTVYFGHGAYGVRSATERFFVTGDPGTGFLRGKRLDELTLGESALLAGLISNPSADDPFTNPIGARTRRAEALEKMVAHHHISEAQAQRAEQEPLPRVPPLPDLRPRNYFVDQVQTSLLGDPRLGPTLRARRERLLKGGLRILSTMDPRVQANAQAAVDSVLPKQPPFTAALVAMDPATGAVRAMIGGPGFDKLQYNLATHQPGRQTGSTYKVITLAAALEAGYSPNDMLDGTAPCTVVRPPLPPWTTVNAEPGAGMLSLRDATADSVNCAFAHLIASVGPNAVVEMAHRLGVTQNVPAYLSITLGTNETTPIEMATVASTLAAGGVRHPPTFVAKVLAPDGKVLIDNTHPSGQRAIDPAIVDCETDMLRGVVDHGTGTAAQIGGHDVAGKTGTTDQKSDAWFLGYTPQLAAVVWMGSATSLAPMTDVGGITVFGGTYPARIWQAFASAQLADQPSAPFPPAGPVCDRPGALVTDGGRDVNALNQPPSAPGARPPKPAPQPPGGNGPRPHG